MLLPVLLVFIAILSAAAAVYGLLPQWMAYEHGLQIIEMTRRLQWPLLTVSLGSCLVLLVLIISGKQKPWWLIGWAPVMALLLQLFVTGNITNMEIVEQPDTVAAKGANFLQDDDWVVGVLFADKAYALPYRQLFNAPVVVLQDRDKRAAVIWSAYANRVLAFNANRQFKTRELDIVSMPANSLLIYNGRVGEFINGVTGLTTRDERPTGIGSRLPAMTTTWARWRDLHPQTIVTSIPTLSTALPVPLSPQFPMRVQTQLPLDHRIVFFHTAPPVAISESRIGREPLNIEVGGVPILLFRDPVTGRVKGFERSFAGRVSRFIANPSKRRADKGVTLLDVATNSGWSDTGLAIDGEEEIVGERLKPVANFDEDLYLGVMQNWYPTLTLLDDELP